MSNEQARRFHDVAIASSASAFLKSASQAAHVKDSELRKEEATSQPPLSKYFALNFNFKPDSTHDCKKGALFQPGPSHSHSADWQLEFEANENGSDPNTSSTPADADAAPRKKPAHVFTGPQTTAKAYDVVLIWDKAAGVYRLDRIASAFSLKYERSKTVLSSQSQEVWVKDATKPEKRSVPRPTGPALAAANSLKRDYGALSQGAGEGSRTPSSSVTTRHEGLKLRSKASTLAPPLRRSSRRSLAVEVEEFDDGAEALRQSQVDGAGRSAEASSSAEVEAPSKNDSRKAKDSAQTEEPPTASQHKGELRRSRRRSGQTQNEQIPNPPESRPLTGPSEATPVEDSALPQSPEADADDLALELERELEREIDLGVSGDDDQAPPIQKGADFAVKQTPPRSLSPVSRIQQSDRQNKINTPKAHTPETEDISQFGSSSLSKEVKRSCSPMTDRSTPVDAGTSVASIGLGLQQTGVGITPRASPHLDITNPQAAFPPADRNRSGSPRPSEGVDDVAHDDEDDDDLQDFAAELDMSLAEMTDPITVAAPSDVPKRRSSRAFAAAQSQRNARKAYGLGGPRQEEEELEDSD